jgi:hypothetical protein
VPDKSPEYKVFDFSVEPIDYVDFIMIDAILSNYSNQNCDAIYMVENDFLSKIERVFMSSLGILMACGKSKGREKHDKSTQQRDVLGCHDNHHGILIMRSITLIMMRCYLVLILMKGEWNELIGHPKDRGKNWPNLRTNYLQQGEIDADYVAVSLFNFPFRIRIVFSIFH